MFRKHRHLPAYEADGSALYGPVAPSDDQMKFQQLDEASADKHSDVEDVSTPEAPQASSSVPGRLIRPTPTVVGWEAACLGAGTSSVHPGGNRHDTKLAKTQRHELEDRRHGGQEES